MSPARKMFLGGLTAAIVVGLGATALAAPQGPLAAPAASQMPLAVEDFNHPGADRYLQERGITLKRGDGHIVLTDDTDLAQCSGASDIAVEARPSDTGQSTVFCFRANTKSGYLTLELPDSFNIWTNDRPVKATLTADGKDTVVNAPANDLTGVGEGGDTGVRSVLVELRVTG